MQQVSSELPLPGSSKIRPQALGPIRFHHILSFLTLVFLASGCSLICPRAPTILVISACGPGRAVEQRFSKSLAISACGPGGAVEKRIFDRSLERNLPGRF